MLLLLLLSFADWDSRLHVSKLYFVDIMLYVVKRMEPSHSRTDGSNVVL